MKSLRIIFVLVVLICLSLYYIRFELVRPFAVADYSIPLKAAQIEKRVQENAIYNIRFGSITNKWQARRAARQVWSEFRGLGEFNRHLPYTVSYDEHADVWKVTGSLWFATVGSVPEIILSADGELLACAWG